MSDESLSFMIVIFDVFKSFYLKRHAYKKDQKLVNFAISCFDL